MADTREMYSASQVDNATVGCFLVFHEIRGPFTKMLKQYPDMLFLSSEFAQSESQHPFIEIGAPDFLKTRIQSLVPFRYIKTCFAMTRSPLEGLTCVEIKWSQ